MDINFQWAFSLSVTWGRIHLKTICTRNLSLWNSWCQATGISHKIKFEFRVEKMAFKRVHVCIFLRKPDVPISKTQASPRDLAETWFTVLKSALGCREGELKAPFDSMLHWQESLDSTIFSWSSALANSPRLWNACPPTWQILSIWLTSEALFCVGWSTGK